MTSCCDAPSQLLCKLLFKYKSGRFHPLLSNLVAHSLPSSDTNTLQSCNKEKGLEIYLVASSER